MAEAVKVRNFRTDLAKLIGESRQQTWFNEDVSIGFTNTTVEIVAPNAFVAKWIATNFLDQIKQVAERLTGHGCEVVIRSAERAKKQIAKPSKNGTSAQGGKPHAIHNTRATKRGVKGTFETFVVGPSNELAFTAARAAIQDASSAYRPLMIHGACGLGKTHLLHAVCNAVRETHPTLACQYISGEDFTNEFIEAVRTNREAQFRERYRKLDILIVDDIHFLENKTATQAEFLHTFNALDSVGRAVILASDRHPRKLADKVNPQLLDRLRNGMVVEILPPVFETRCEILRKLAQTHAVKIPTAAIELIARHVTSNVRALERVFNTLRAHTRLSQREVDASLVRRVLDMDGLLDERPLQCDGIVTAVCDVLGVSEEVLRSNARNRTVSMARAIAMFLLRTRLETDFATIGKQFGGKHHTTAMAACRKIETLIQTDATVAHVRGGVSQATPIQELLAAVDARLAPPME